MTSSEQSTTATARACGLLACPSCALVSRPVVPSQPMHCPRCGAKLQRRKPQSIARTSALLLTALVFYIPANLLPIMHTGSLFGAQSDTILSGIIYLWHTGAYDLAVIVFIASIVVPLGKLIVLSFLLITVQWRWTWQPLQRTRLYRALELVGKWSMLDIYVVALLASLVHFQAVASITVGTGAIAFGAVVVLTILAAHSFDPRLIWDSSEPRQSLDG